MNTSTETRGARLALVAAASAIVSLTVTSTASATFPGRDGRIALSYYGFSYSGLATMRPDGSGRRRLFPVRGQNGEPTVYAADPSWAPDGRHFLVGTSSPIGEGKWTQGFAVVSADGSSRTEVPLQTEPIDGNGSEDGPNVIGHPSFGPDGTSFIYTRRVTRVPSFEIWLATIDGRINRRLAIGAHGQWSPDGRFIAYMAPTSTGYVPDDAAELGEISLMDAQSGRRIRRVVRSGALMDWASDSRRILYTTDAFTLHTGALIAVDTRGRHARRMFTTSRNEVTAAAWSPTGSRLAVATVDFGQADDDESCDLFVLRTSSRRRSRIAHDGSGLCGFDVAWQSRP